MSRRGLVVLVAVVALAGGAAYLGRRYPGTREDGGAPRYVPRERVRVEVLNAGGVAGLAREVTNQLRDDGFDVVQFGNAGSFDRDSTVVIDRVGRESLAEGVANALGIRNVLSQPDPNLFVDVTVLLGRDWAERTGGDPLGAPPDRAPWDPRGWLGR
ncbi:MAG: LytR family transcriptional regulator [Gemmatimonadetes bacterium]|nr:LytR family transcriptional regulator [Gemmatimonadota bacterium]